MPDIITIPAGGGGASYTRTLERMVHFKLGTPQFFNSEQIHASSWRLVRNNPVDSSTWHPKDDNLEGVDTVYGGASYYGSRDNNANKWSVPFNVARPAHVGQTSYSNPDEMFISNTAMTKWIYFARTALVAQGQEMNVLASDANNAPHLVVRYHPGNDPMGPWICARNGANHLAHVVYAEASDATYNPQAGSLIFVRKQAA